MLVLAGMLLSDNLSAQDEIFANKRLARIANRLKQQKTGYNVHTRVNEWGEVEHIGLRLFHDAIRKLVPAKVTCDFLERYLLELNLEKGTEYGIILSQKDVDFTVGSAVTALEIDSTALYTIDEIEFHKYRATWQKDEKLLLQVVFDMDYQLMTGASISELEQRFITELQRSMPEAIDTLPRRGTYIISPAINNDLYIMKEKGNRKSETRPYVYSAKQASRSVANLMLADDMPVDAQLKLTVSRYDRDSDTLNLPLRQFLQYCRSREKCTPYFGLKSADGNNFEGLLLMANPHAGYMHMLKVSVPKEMIGKDDVEVEGRLMVYIPMHNVKQEYLNLTEYETIR